MPLYTSNPLSSHFTVNSRCPQLMSRALKRKFVSHQTLTVSAKRKSLRTVPAWSTVVCPLRIAMLLSGTRNSPHVTGAHSTRVML